MKIAIRRFPFSVLSGVALAIAASSSALAQTQQYPNRPIEFIVPFAAGGGTDVMARAFADAAQKHLPQPMVVMNKPGASGTIGWSYIAGAPPDGYKIAVITTELAIVPHLGVTKLTYQDLLPIARLNYDPSAITVKADSPFNTVEEFLDAAKKKPGAMNIGNAGNGSIWHMAAAALEDKTGTKFGHVPFQGANPAILALLGGHVDAVTVSPAEVYPHVSAGKLKTLAVMADQRVKGFENVPTLKERNIDLTIGTWRGIAVAKNTSPEVLAVLRPAIAKAAAEPAFREKLDKQNLGFAYADEATFKNQIARENDYFKQMAQKLGLKP